MSTLPDSRYLDNAGARLCYRDQGAGPAVVLIHGWLLDSTLWTAQAAAWSTRFRVLSMDRRGCGASTGATSLADDARDVALLLDRLGIVRAARRKLHHRLFEEETRPHSRRTRPPPGARLRRPPPRRG